MLVAMHDLVPRQNQAIVEKVNKTNTKAAAGISATLGLMGCMFALGDAITTSAIMATLSASYATFAAHLNKIEGVADDPPNDIVYQLFMKLDALAEEERLADMVRELQFEHR